MRINSKIKLYCFVLFFAIVSCSAINAVFAAEQLPSYTLNLAQYQTGPDFPGYRMAEYFKARVEELSEGRITVKHYPGDLLGDWVTQQIAVKEGSLDMTMAPATATFDPEIEFLFLPYMVFTWDGVRDVFGAGGKAEDLLNKIYSRNNVYYLANQPGGFINNVSNKKFTPLPGDPSIKDVKTRVMPSKMEEVTGKTLGFQTLSMDWGEIHSALMLGTIDAANGPAYPEAPLFKDVVKYQYNYQYTFASCPVIMNLELWNSLDKEDQEIIQTAMTEAAEIEWERAVEAQETAVREMEEAGVEVIDLTTEQMAANVAACRDKVWSWAAENFFSEELMKAVLSFAEPLPE